MGCQCKKFPAKDFGVYAFTEISNGFGEGPILRAQRDYVNYYSAKSVRFRPPSKRKCINYYIAQVYPQCLLLSCILDCNRWFLPGYFGCYRCR